MRNLNAENILHLFNELLTFLPDRWQRRRVQSPRTILATLLILAIERGTTSTRRALTLLSDMFPESSRVRREPCPAAFSRARLQLDEEAIRSVFDAFSSRLKPQSTFRIQGYRLVAIDGSQLSLPRTSETVSEFGCYEHRRSSYQPQSRLVAAWDVMERRPIDWIVGECFQNERSAAVEMIRRLPADSIVLLDRGFHGIGAIHAFSQAGIGCFVRARTGKTAWLNVQKFVRSKANDAVIEVSGTVDGEPKSMFCRAVKATRINARKRKRETLVFLTNLMDRDLWTRSTLLKLYSLRWDIETAFRELKIQDRVESFHAKTPDGIRQELAAYMIARLLAGIVLGQVTYMPGVDLTWNCARRHVFNHVTVVDAVIDVIRSCVCDADLHKSTKIIRHHFWIIRDAVQRRRPGRSFIRKCQGRYGRWKGTKNHRQQKGRNSQAAFIS